MKYKGLNQKELNENYNKYGRNKIEEIKKHNWFYKIFEVLKEPMFLLLIVCSLVYFLTGEYIDGTVMLFAVTAIIWIELYQQGKTDKTLKKLKELSNPQSNVVRDGKITTINSEDLTIDDILYISEGDRISADAIILEAHQLNIDESALTGESIMVLKQLNLDDENYFKKNYVYAGTLVTSGNAYAKVTAIALNTESGKINAEISKAPRIITPLEKQINMLVKFFATIAFLAFAFLVAISYYHTHDLVESFLRGITLALGLIPEEFPVVFTVFLTMGAYRLAIHNALVRKLASVEALGSINMLFSDKTGTITLNKQKVVAMSSLDETLLTKAAYLASDKETFDPMDLAIHDINKEDYNDYQLIHKHPFSSDSKLMANVYEHKGKKYCYVKGALDILVNHTNLSKTDQAQVLKECRDFNVKGLRVIGVAFVEIKTIKEHISDYQFEYIGMLGLQDPPRPGVKEAIATCHQAGIQVLMITGDHGDTALAIGKQIGLKNTNDYLTGGEIETLDDEALYQKLKSVSVIARVVPAHKSRIVNLCRNHNDIVAMTGDGVNDAPALKNANIGISMGKRGTEVAKEASGLILTDDNFNTIVSTIKDARKIYENIKKASIYIMIVHIPLILFSLLIPILDLPLFLLPIIIVMFELIIDPVCSVVFERIPSHKEIMSKPPRNPNESLISMQDILKVITIGLVIFGAAFFPYFLISPHDHALAKSMALVVIFCANLFLPYVLANNTCGLIRNFIKLIKDPVIMTINIIIVIIIAGMLYVPFISNFIGTVPLNMTALLTSVFLGLGSVIWYDIIKLTKVIIGYARK